MAHLFPRKFSSGPAEGEEEEEEGGEGSGQEDEEGGDSDSDDEEDEDFNPALGEQPRYRFVLLLGLSAFVSALSKFGDRESGQVMPEYCLTPCEPFAPWEVCWFSKMFAQCKD